MATLLMAGGEQGRKECMQHVTMHWFPSQLEEYCDTLSHREHGDFKGEVMHALSEQQRKGFLANVIAEDDSSTSKLKVELMRQEYTGAWLNTTNAKARAQFLDSLRLPERLRTEAALLYWRPEDSRERYLAPLPEDKERALRAALISFEADQLVIMPMQRRLRALLESSPEKRDAYLKTLCMATGERQAIEGFVVMNMNKWERAKYMYHGLSFWKQAGI